MNDMNPSLPLPLNGIKVVEFCHTIMGPTAGLILADLGADVIKIEPLEGDRTRRLPGFAASFFGTFNRNKRSLALDIKTSTGKEIVYQLIAHSDVVLENFAPGTMERLNCGYETLAKYNSRLVFCALKGFLSGPYEHRPALDEVVQFMAGLAYMTGPPGQPLRAGTSVVDIMGGAFAVIGILAALREREDTGRGQLVKSALFESTAFLMAQHMAGYSIAGRPVPPMPAREGAWAVYEPFTTVEGEQVFVGITSDGHWQRFCQRFGCEELLNDPAYASNEARVKKRPTLLPFVAEIIEQYTREEICQILDEIALPFSAVARSEDLFDDPHLNAGGRLLDVELGGAIKTRLPKLPIEIGGHDFNIRQQPPIQGEHTEEILQALGISAEEIESLGNSKVIFRGKK